jgi:hypothetical protein
LILELPSVSDLRPLSAGNANTAFAHVAHPFYNSARRRRRGAHCGVMITSRNEE